MFNAFTDIETSDQCQLISSSQLTFTCSMSAVEILENGVKYVQS